MKARSRNRIFWAPLVMAALVGCEEDILTPTSAFEPEDCEDLTNCGDVTYRVDSGVRVPDTGLPTGEEDAGGDPNGGTDGGVDAGEGATDSGVTIDAGFVDAGFPDSGLPPERFLNLAGSWRTHYLFDVSDYAFGISNIADEIDFIDNVIRGNLSTGFPPLDALIRDLVDQIVPQWVRDVVSTLNVIATLFEYLEVVAMMNLSQSAPADPWATSTQLSGNETWTVLYALILDRNRCPLGRMDPAFPTCARVPVNFSQQPTPIAPTPSGRPVTVQVYVAPFDGTLQSGVPEADFVLNDREVEVEFRALVLLLIDQFIIITTPYNGLEDWVRDVVDCSQLGQDAYNLAVNDLGLSPALGIAARVAVTDLCNDTVDDAIDGVASFGISERGFRFDQMGHAVDRPPLDGAPMPRADVLQVLNRNGPDTIDGRFSVVGSSDLGGHWEAPY